MISFIALTLTGIITGIVQKNEISQVFLGWRMYLLPFLWAFLLYKTSFFKHTKAVTIVRYLVFVPVLIVLVALYYNEVYRQDLRILWFYNFIDEINPIESHAFDFIRDDKLRATGIFVSPLIYATYLSISLIILFFYLLFSRRSFLKSFGLFSILLLLVYGQYLSRTRIGFIIFAVALIGSALAYFKPSTRFSVFLSVPLILLLFTFLSLGLGFSEDPSALGRLLQYASVPEHFILFGVGFGSELTNVRFDSFYISVLLLFGVLAPLYFRLYFVLLKKMHRCLPYFKSCEHDIHERIIFYAGFGYCLSFLYTFGFHFTAGSATIQMFYLLLFYSISKYSHQVTNDTRVKLTTSVDSYGKC
ncbi:hypothetical protein [Pseudocnuella soli]|uniref:hypothetical protein n=1 Tax=Pseudocnuella soli TaxID=2502779 RepID=UPI0010519A51|nr:hypothetical protein [Pseudocnuella soli]